MRNLLVSLVAASILSASSLAAADEPAPTSAPVASPAAAPVAPATAALPVVAPVRPTMPLVAAPFAPAPLGQAERSTAIVAAPRIRSRALVAGGIGAGAGGIMFMTFGIWAMSQPVTKCSHASHESTLATDVLGSLEAICTVGEGAGEALRTGGEVATVIGGLGIAAGVTMITLGARPARAATETARVPAPTLSLGPRSAALRWTF